ncbi:MAG: hypothetical protein M5U22_12210 [Thermoleophilia bacterium]|nr:hypothetical protein [Thermoleophilia bacterium]
MGGAGGTGGSPRSGEGAQLRRRIESYVRAHHTMTVATYGRPWEVDVEPPGSPGPDWGRTGAAVGLVPHAATVFYAADDRLRLIFLSKRTSLHGVHIRAGSPVAVTVAEEFQAWRDIQGVQLWGEATVLSGLERAAALAVYVARFPFVREMMAEPRLAAIVRGIDVFRVTPVRAAFTDNRSGLFGREVLELGC